MFQDSYFSQDTATGYSLSIEQRWAALLCDTLCFSKSIDDAVRRGYYSI